MSGYTGLLGGINIPNKECLLGQTAFTQNVPDFYCADQVMAREAVKVVNAELQESMRQVLVRHREGKRLVEFWVQGFPVNFRLMLHFAIRHQINLQHKTYCLSTSIFRQIWNTTLNINNLKHSTISFIPSPLLYFLCLCISHPPLSVYLSLVVCVVSTIYLNWSWC